MAVVKPQSPIINWGNPLTKGLVHNLAFFENTPNLFNLAGGKLLPTTNNNPTWGVGLYGKRLTFLASSSQYVDTKYTVNLANSDSLTLTILMKIESTTSSSNPVPFGAKITGGNYPEMSPYLNTGKMGFYISGTTSGNAQVAPAGADQRDGKWHFWNFVKNGNERKLYIYRDGVLFGSNTESVTGGINLTGTTFTVNAQNVSGTPSGFLNMDVAFTSIHTVPLSGNQIALYFVNPWQIYQQPKIYSLYNAATPIKDLIGGFGFIPFSR